MLRKLIGIGAGLAGAFASGAALALPYDWQMGFQPAASPVMERIEDFHHFVLVIITLITLFVLALLIWIIIRYNHRANPVPSKVSHNTTLEIVWTLVPVIILVIIAIPSFKLLYYEAEIPPPDLTITAIGHQWSWTYKYPTNGNFQFDSLPLSEDQDKKAGEPRLLGVDNPIEYGASRRHPSRHSRGAGEQGRRSRYDRRRCDPFLGDAADGREDGRRAGPH